MLTRVLLSWIGVRGGMVLIKAARSVLFIYRGYINEMGHLLKAYCVWCVTVVELLLNVSIDRLGE